MARPPALPREEKTRLVLAILAAVSVRLVLCALAIAVTRSLIAGAAALRGRAG